ncbi:L,D-transpeptidase [Mangrovicoccus ximenensis]|uniref:L,D-transpeptidase n=1 Tax=Mangrovicoccus ximenensis TaxID=1911570 RepID=UPI000D3BE9D9|nr:L,D-transpeptidase [Mangrovicoccus ximenensis]
MTSFRPTRRLFLASAGSTLIFAAGAAGEQVLKEIADLEPGEFTWHPERSPEGPVAVIASLDEQRVHVYRNGIRIAVSTCSTGKPGHETPTGVFVVLQKDKDHHSSTYNNASMPNMNRLTWDGIALHAGKLPGYPASHGCVRLPMEFSAKLFGITHLGTPVIIADSHHAPASVVHPGLLLSGMPEAELEAAVDALEAQKHPADWPQDGSRPVVSMVVSSLDGRIVLIENDREIGSGRLVWDGAPLGSHVYVLQGAGTAAAPLHWTALGYGASAPEDWRAPLARIGCDPEFRDLARRHSHPGTMMVVTDLPLHPDSRSGRDFVIMNS